MKYYIQLAFYYVCILVKYSLLVVVRPASAVFETLNSIVSDWEPSEPLHKTDEPDPMQDPDNLGI